MGEPFLKHLRVQNFKSFGDLDIEFKKFNVLVGANATGKSNFTQIFKFMKDMRGGLADALAIQGGVEYVRNFNSNDRLFIDLELDFASSEDTKLPPGLSNPQYLLHNTYVKWSFELEMGKKSGFTIISDAWKFYITGTKKQDRIDGILDIKSENGRISIRPDFPIDIMDKKALNLHKTKITKSKSILESPIIMDFMFPWVGFFFDQLEIYDFSPKLAKQPSAIGGRIGLATDGSNLPIVLRDIMSNTTKKRKFLNLVSDILPFVKSLGVQSTVGKSLMFMIEERYSNGRDIPASLVSDGTANAVALIVALYFEGAWLTVIEEPERNVHPRLLSGLVDMMIDASSNTQIIITTHSPEIVRQSGIDSLLLISRSDSGSSTITRPSEARTVRSFLENEMDIGEMHVQDLLGD